MGFDERRALRFIGWAVAIVFVAGVLSLVAKGADGPADPYFRAEATAGQTASGQAGAVPPAPAPTVPVRTPVAGFGQIAFRIGSGPQHCGLLADTPAQQQTGLMGRSDLAGHDAMLFRFRTPTNTPFYMRNTALPLSIAWFDATGRFVSSADMDPCLGRTDCPTYAAARPYRYALEVPRGGLTGLGIGAGTQLVVGAGC
jgi:uncharacterized membrane protein (UPF0127 family)